MPVIEPRPRRKKSKCPQCEGRRTLNVPVVTSIQTGYRTLRVANYEVVLCGRCLGEGEIL